MTMQTPQPPPSALRAVLAALDSEAALCQPAAAALRGAVGPLLPSHPLAVHILEGPGSQLATARRTGWRFLIKRGSATVSAEPAATAEVAAAAEVVETADGHSFSHFTAGPYLDSTVRALRQAWQLAQSSRSRHQPRLLSMPEHYAAALWLHHPEPGPATDLLIPLAPAPCGVTAHRVYPAAELLAMLERAAVPARLTAGIS
ncbi:hypothetical protein [Kitasatospora sp. GP82]|uniref:hypothetical protein n=1 Tax=Kitasatospora sp. GP82 TaxID=3035089 RepID=UPI002473AE64|nr:hypothetical protein [Kitasatospora sp. GP82]MDH6125096.1 hypothetical protein [Kitasatospora sp. GP82]